MGTPTLQAVREKIPVTPALYQDYLHSDHKEGLRHILAQGIGQNGYKIEYLTPTDRVPVDPSHIVINRGRHYLVYRPAKNLAPPKAPGSQQGRPTTRIVQKEILHYVGFLQDPLSPDLDDVLEIETPNELHNTQIFRFKDRSREKPFEWKDGDPIIPDDEWASAMQLRAYLVDDGKHGHVKSRYISMERIVSGNPEGLVKAMLNCSTDLINAEIARQAAERKTKPRRKQ